ncbi:cytochrome d ubiquinol oxidase subunit II [Mechercharimyces sp. CAU 1602]|uniref:cytochrome d ubiquinol oxidase subunit II n=1 Tax=Mechercharimyces sp. CAU 1602 TaxID=2973933 RepID=UPI002162A693|nr:cytochrome d ubiquinol oxidase subunit II [Mechercharimyces sp. CAU 1602]MCS1350557.1 cytochrome d ubiquinol oxidase subunit II [Mechercharimyces sp. CAU 1602]
MDWLPLEYIGITVLWTFLYGYLIIASIDFGAGFFSYYSMLTKKDSIVGKVINRYLSPVWEVTNVFLVFFFVGMIGFFPDTAYYYGTALLLPASVALVLLTIRGSFYAFAQYGARQSRIYMFLYGITGLFIPASLATVLTISEGGYIAIIEGEVTFLVKTFFLSPYSWSVVWLALISILFISASFLTYYAHRAQDEPALSILRNYALVWSLPTILASFLVFVALENHNPIHFANMMSLWWMFILSLLFFIVAVILIWKKRYLGWAFLCVMLQFAFAFYGYGASHLPYLLYPYITIDSGFTNGAMGWALVIAFLAGLILLVPSLLLLLRLFIFDANYVRGETK